MICLPIMVRLIALSASRVIPAAISSTTFVAGAAFDLDPLGGYILTAEVIDFTGVRDGGAPETVRITSRRLTELIPGSKQLTVKWEASKNFTGYEVQIATDSAFTKNVKTSKVSNADTVSTVFKSLNNSTTYYARVRSYHVFEGMTYYGDWSNVLSNSPGSSYVATLSVRRALLIGETDYESGNKLNGCVNDINALGGTLDGLRYRFRSRAELHRQQRKHLSEV